MGGVGRGEFALQILKKWTSGLVYLCDPYIHIVHGYTDTDNLSDVEHQRVFEGLSTQLGALGYPGRYAIVRDFSFSLARLWASPLRKTWPVANPQFVYVDANHRYEAVLADVRGWWPLLMPGGILAGSNYRNDADTHIGVR